MRYDTGVLWASIVVNVNPDLGIEVIKNRYTGATGPLCVDPWDAKRIYFGFNDVKLARAIESLES
jgi:hypothetical protein